MSVPTASTAGIEHLTDLALRVLAPNPSPARLEGTNSYLLAGPGSGSVVVVDPGPPDEGHLRRLTAEGRVEPVLLTHRHLDHAEAVEALAARTGAPVRAIDPRWCRDAPSLRDGERIDVAHLHIRVLATPGHTADSASFHLPQDRVTAGGLGEGGSVIVGDTVLGRGGSTLSPPDGSLADYLVTLARLRDLGPVVGLPGHGPVIPDLAVLCDRALVRRRDRLGEIDEVLLGLGLAPEPDDETVRRVTDDVYRGLDPALRHPAEDSVRAHLAFLAAAGVR